MNTLKQIADYIVNKSLSTPPIKESSWGFIRRFEELNSKLYPYAFLVVSEFPITPYSSSFNFSLVVADLLDFDFSNENNLISDCFEIAHSILSAIDREQLVLLDNINITPFTTRGTDNVAGCTANFTVNVDKPFNICS